MKLAWTECENARDLGGLPTRDGGRTRHGALVRSGNLDRLSEHGWQQVWDHGVRTVIDLRNDDERGRSRYGDGRPPGLTTHHLPLDGMEDREFWKEWATGPQFGTPLYFRPHLERLPDRSGAVLRAIAHAPPGGVLYHCQGGRDRTGQITLLVLSLAGVRPSAIAEDYLLSEPDASSARYLREQGVSQADVLAETVAGLDLPAHLGLSDQDVDALRARLVET